jgi:hypothetical protein
MIKPRDLSLYGSDYVQMERCFELGTKFLVAEQAMKLILGERLLWNPKFHYRVYKNLALPPILSQINPVHTTPCFLSKIYLNIIHLLTLWSSKLLFSFGISTGILYAFVFSILTKCPDNLIILHLIILFYSPKSTGYESAHCALYSSFLSHHPSSVLVTLFSDALCLCFSLNVGDNISNRYRTTRKIIVLYILISEFLDSR